MRTTLTENYSRLTYNFCLIAFAHKARKLTDVFGVRNSVNFLQPCLFSSDGFPLNTYIRTHTHTHARVWNSYKNVAHMQLACFKWTNRKSNFHGCFITKYSILPFVFTYTKLE